MGQGRSVIFWIDFVVLKRSCFDVLVLCLQSACHYICSRNQYIIVHKDMPILWVKLHTNQVHHANHVIYRKHPDLSHSTHYIVFVDIIAIPKATALTLIKTLVIPIAIGASRCLAIVVLAARSKATNLIVGAPEWAKGSPPLVPAFTTTIWLRDSAEVPVALESDDLRKVYFLCQTSSW